MSYSEYIMETLDSALFDEQSDFEPDPDTPDDRPFTEVVVNFLERLGIEEGIDFIIDNDDIYPAAAIEMDFDLEPFKNLTFDKWQNVFFSYDGKSDNVTVSDSSTGETFEMPLGIFFMVQHYASA